MPFPFFLIFPVDAAAAAAFAFAATSTAVAVVDVDVVVSSFGFVLFYVGIVVRCVRIDNGKRGEKTGGGAEVRCGKGGG